MLLCTEAIRRTFQRQRQTCRLKPRSCVRKVPCRVRVAGQLRPFDRFLGAFSQSHPSSETLAGLGRSTRPRSLPTSPSPRVDEPAVRHRRNAPNGGSKNPHTQPQCSMNANWPGLRHERSGPSRCRLTTRPFRGIGYSGATPGAVGDHVVACW